MSNWREAEARKKAEAEARQAEEDRKKREVLAQVKAEAEQNAGPRAAGEIRVARNEGEAARFGGGGEVLSLWFCFEEN